MWKIWVFYEVTRFEVVCALGKMFDRLDLSPHGSLCCRLPLDDPWSVLRLLCPDLGVCVVSLVTVILCSRLVRNREMVAAANITSVSSCLSVCNYYYYYCCI